MIPCFVTFFRVIPVIAQQLQAIVQKAEKDINDQGAKLQRARLVAV